MNTRVLLAVLKRNFVSYFVNPTGYVFICVFVLLSSFAAFWSPEFFNANLANLNQLNKVFPFIMLVFVPAVTMSIWAEERRQGTDELLLTIPGNDLDIVLGKYLAAVAIYTVSLGFSLACNLGVLWTLGDPDMGLFLGTYAGYWMIGLAMLAVGMVASFVTSNLTVGYLLGALLNVPMVLAVWADAIVFLPSEVALAVKRWSAGEQLAEFSRGVVSLASIVYFLGIVAVMLYLSVVLIGRRHWPGGPARMPNSVFLWAIHLVWMASFATLYVGLVGLAGAIRPAGILIVLAALYLALHGGLLWGWTRWPRAAALKPLDLALPALQVALVAGFVVFAAFAAPHIHRVLLIILFLLYAAAHAAFFWGWLRLPHKMTLTPSHYVVRTLALVGLAAGAAVFLQFHDRRLDVTRERLNTLSPDTLQLLDNLRQDLVEPVQIEAFISPSVPEAYIQTRLNILSMLREIQDRVGDMVQLRINILDQNSEDAVRAERLYGITPREIPNVSRGTASLEQVFLGVAFTSGVEKVIVPFIDRGIPVEYELVRSICTFRSPEAVKSIADLQVTRDLHVEAFVSPTVPKSYAKTRENLLKALDALGNRRSKDRRVDVKIHETRPGSDEARRAAKYFDITPRPVEAADGKPAESIFLGVVLQCGEDRDRNVERQVLPFLSAETDVGEAVAEAARRAMQQRRKRIGVLGTQAMMFVRDDDGKSVWPIIDELKKLYDVEEVRAADPITQRYDAILAVQPSTLGKKELRHFVQAVQAGQPTIIFEDPFPIAAPWIQPTAVDPSRELDPMAMMGRAPPRPSKADFWQLCNLLGISFSSDEKDLVDEMVDSMAQKFNRDHSKEGVRLDPKSQRDSRSIQRLREACLEAAERFRGTPETAMTIEKIPLESGGFIHLEVPLERSAFTPWRRIAVDLVAKCRRDHGVDLRKDEEAMKRLELASQEAALRLGSSPETTVRLQAIAAGSKGPIDLEETLQRATFAPELTLLRHFLDKCYRDHRVDLRSNPKAMKRLEEAARDAAQRLWGASQTAVKVPEIALGPRGPIDLDETVQRSAFRPWRSIVWQQYNPYPRMGPQAVEFVFVDQGAALHNPFSSANPITSGLQRMFFPAPGSLLDSESRLPAAQRNAARTFSPLVWSGTKSGTVPLSRIRVPVMSRRNPMDVRYRFRPARARDLEPTEVQYTLAARVRGRVPAVVALSDPEEPPSMPEGPDEMRELGEERKWAQADAAAAGQEVDVDVVVVADVDVMSGWFFDERARGDIPERDVQFDFDNVTFVLNALDVLTGDTRFVEIRKRRPRHRTLTRVEETTAQVYRGAAQEIKSFSDQHDKSIEAIEEELRKEQKRIIDQGIQRREALVLGKKPGEAWVPGEALVVVPGTRTDEEFSQAQERGERRKNTVREESEQQLNSKIKQKERELAFEVRRVQDWYKIWAVLLPPLPPLVVAGVVFFTRRIREREGVAQSRLR